MWREVQEKLPLMRKRRSNLKEYTVFEVPSTCPATGSRLSWRGHWLSLHGWQPARLDTRIKAERTKMSLMVRPRLKVTICGREKKGAVLGSLPNIGYNLVRRLATFGVWANGKGNGMTPKGSKRLGRSTRRGPLTGACNLKRFSNVRTRVTPPGKVYVCIFLCCSQKFFVFRAYPSNPKSNHHRDVLDYVRRVK